METPATTTTRLKADLTMIKSAIKKSDGVPDSIKNLFGEIIAWNEALIEYAKEQSERVELAEVALSELMDDAGDLVSVETAGTILAGIEHGKLLCQAVDALISGQLAAYIDDVSKQRFVDLIKNTNAALALSEQVVNEITVEDDGDEDDGDDDDLDVEGGDMEGDAADDDEGEIDGSDDRNNDGEEEARG